MPVARRNFATALACLCTATASAYELAANRFTLVLRGETHLSLTWFIDHTAALHRALAPRHALQEFLRVYAVKKPAKFQKELLRAQAKFSAGSRLTRSTREPLAATNWQWPEPISAHRGRHFRRIVDDGGGAQVIF